jgi:hypothetical protein
MIKAGIRYIRTIVKYSKVIFVLLQKREMEIRIRYVLKDSCNIHRSFANQL